MTFFQLEIKNNSHRSPADLLHLVRPHQKLLNFLRKISVYLISLIVIGVGLFIFYFYFAENSEAVWFDDEYHYRQIFTFSHNADIASERAITFSLDTAELIAAGVMQSDCDDTRFTDINGKLLRYQLTGTCNNAATTYEVVFPSIINGTNTGYVYYGNPSAVSASVDVSAVTALTPSGGDPAITDRTNEVKGTSPVLYWKFNDGTGTTTQDSTSQNNDGTVSGATWESGGVTANKGEFSLKFDGSNDFVSKSYSSDTELNPGTTNMSVSAWFRHSSSISGTDVLISRFATGGYQVYMKSTGVVCFGIDDDGASFSAKDEACSTASYADSKWHFIEGVKNGTSSLTIYIDGVSVGTDSSLTVTGSISGSSPTFYVGIDSDGTSNPWDGFIDEIKVFTSEQSARSASQVKADFIARSSAEGNSAVLGQDTNSTNFASGLVGYWKMDENSGTTTADSSGNNNTSSTFTGNATWTTGKYGSGLIFDGTDDVVRIAESTSTDLGNAEDKYTASIWFKTTTNFSTFSTIFAKEDSAGTTPFTIQISASETICIGTASGGSTTRTCSSGTAYNDGLWHHALAVIDRTANIRYIYVDGILRNSGTTQTGDLRNNRDLSIGNSNGPTYVTNDFTGSTDHARLYNRALTPIEIQNLFNFAPGPVGWWKMDENTGQDLFDSSGNGNTGTVGDTNAVNTDDPTWSPGKFGSSLLFDGSNDIADTVTAATLGIDDGDKAFSIMLWLKTTDTGEKYLFDNCNACGTNISLRLDGGKYESFVSDGTNNNGNPQYGSASQFNNGAWHHFALTWNAGTEKVYGDGILLGTTSATSVTGSLETGNVFRIAQRVGTSTFVNGNFDDIKVYNYDRSQAQVIEDMNANHPAPGSPVGSPVAYWKIDQGYGTTVEDSSENNNDLTMNSSSWTSEGKFNKAWNGTGGNLRMSRSTDSDLEFSESEDFSLSFWYKSDSATNPSATEYLLANGGPAGSAGYAVYANTNGTLCFGIDDDTTWGPDVSSCTATDVYDNAWHHVTAVRNVSLDKTFIYLDARERDSDNDTTTATLDSNTTFFIGDMDTDDAGSGEEFAGDIDEIKIFRLALTSEQVKTDFNRGQAIVYGALSTTSTGVVSSDSYSREFCVPGDTSTCNPPVAHWMMEEGTGSIINDSSGNSNVSSTFTGDVAWTTGKFGKGLSFDGNDDVVRIPETTSTDVGDTSSSYSVSAWFKTTFDSSQFMEIVGKRGGTTTYPIRFGLDTSERAHFELRHGATTSPSTGTTALNDGRWHHIAAVRNVSTDTHYLYVDGLLVDSDTDVTTATTANNEDISIGNAGSAYVTQDFNGQIDGARIYNYARTASQIAWEYNRGKPLGHWKLDEGQGTTANDSSGNGYTGTLTNSPTWASGTGKYHNGVTFGNSTNHITMGDVSAFELTTFTLSAWFYRTGTCGTFTECQLISKGNNSTIGYSLGVNDNDGPYRAGLYLRDTTQRVNGITTINTNQWYHIAASIDGTTVKVYVNGKLETSTAQTTTPTFGSESFKIGNGNTNNDLPGQGTIDDARIYNYALTDNQIKTLYNQDSAVRYGPITGTP